MSVGFYLLWKEERSSQPKTKKNHQGPSNLKVPLGEKYIPIALASAFLPLTSLIFLGRSDQRHVLPCSHVSLQRKLCTDPGQAPTAQQVVRLVPQDSQQVVASTLFSSPNVRSICSERVPSIFDFV
jgi:hypothetical protein